MLIATRDALDRVAAVPSAERHRAVGRAIRTYAKERPDRVPAADPEVGIGGDRAYSAADRYLDALGVAVECGPRNGIDVGDVLAERDTLVAVVTDGRSLDAVVFEGWLDETRDRLTTGLEPAATDVGSLDAAYSTLFADALD